MQLHQGNWKGDSFIGLVLSVLSVFFVFQTYSINMLLLHTVSVVYCTVHVYLGFWLPQCSILSKSDPNCVFFRVQARLKSLQTPWPIVWRPRQPIAKERQELYVSFKSPLADRLGTGKWINPNVRLERRLTESFKVDRNCISKDLRAKVAAKSKVCDLLKSCYLCYEQTTQLSQLHNTVHLC